MTSNNKRNARHLARPNINKAAKNSPRVGRLVCVTVLLTSTLLGCGGNSPRADYKRSVDVREQCCAAVTDMGQRESCMGEITRVEAQYTDSRDVGRISRCISEHFICNEQSGRPTKRSAQKQFDCIQDLGLAQN